MHNYMPIPVAELLDGVKEDFIRCAQCGEQITDEAYPTEDGTPAVFRA